MNLGTWARWFPCRRGNNWHDVIESDIYPKYTMGYRYHFVLWRMWTLGVAIVGISPACSVCLPRRQPTFSRWRSSRLPLPAETGGLPWGLVGPGWELEAESKFPFRFTSGVHGWGNKTALPWCEAILDFITRVIVVSKCLFVYIPATCIEDCLSWYQSVVFFWTTY